MKINDNSNNECNLTDLCNSVRKLVGEGQYKESNMLIANAMGAFPHAPEPHNLMGILLERQNDHLSAMKHFRAAWALDPTYIPARININQYGDFFCKMRKDAFDESDCPVSPDKNLYKIEYDENGIGRLVMRTKKDLNEIKK